MNRLLERVGGTNRCFFIFFFFSYQRLNFFRVQRFILLALFMSRVHLSCRVSGSLQELQPSISRRQRAVRSGEGGLIDEHCYQRVALFIEDTAVLSLSFVRHVFVTCFVPAVVIRLVSLLYKAVSARPTYTRYQHSRTVRSLFANTGVAGRTRCQADLRRPSLSLCSTPQEYIGRAPTAPGIETRTGGGAD